MAKEFLGRGWKYPVRVDGLNHVALSVYEEDIREAIRIILGTAKGERVMRPDFGCGIHDLVFAPLNAATVGQVKSGVMEALTLWEPRIELIGVEVDQAKLDDGVLLVGIDYRVRDTNSRSNLVFPFYLKER